MLLVFSAPLSAARNKKPILVDARSARAQVSSFFPPFRSERCLQNVLLQCFGSGHRPAAANCILRSSGDGHMLWFWTVRAAPRDTAPVAFALPPSPPRRKKPANLSLLQPTAALGLRHPGKKKETRDGRPLDRCGPEFGGSLPLWSSLELPLPRCAASIPRCLVCSSLYFQDRRAIEQLRSKARGARKAKKMLLWFLGGWVGLQKKKKKRRVFYTPREWTAPTEAAEPARDPGPLSKQLFRKTL